MGCLVQVILKQTADSQAKKYKVFARHIKFLKSVEPVAEEEVSGRDAYSFYVPWGENKTSQYILETLCHDRDVMRAKIIS